MPRSSKSTTRPARTGSPKGKAMPPKFEILPQELPSPEDARTKPLEAIEKAVEIIQIACKEGRYTRNHTDYGRFLEAQRFSERIANICAVMKSDQPSGTGKQ